MRGARPVCIISAESTETLALTVWLWEGQGLSPDLGSSPAQQEGWTRMSPRSCSIFLGFFDLLLCCTCRRRFFCLPPEGALLPKQEALGSAEFQLIVATLIDKILAKNKNSCAALAEGICGIPNKAFQIRKLPQEPLLESLLFSWGNSSITYLLGLLCGGDLERISAGQLVSEGKQATCTFPKHQPPMLLYLPSQFLPCPHPTGNIY